MKNALLAALLLCLTAAASAQPGPRPTKPADLSVWIAGNGVDKVVDLSDGPGVLLMGGGTEVDIAFRDRAFPVAKGGDIVVIRASGSDGYNDYLLNDITTGPLKPDSVETMRIDTRAKADSDYVAWVLDTAEFIWMAGGDQSDYTGNWRGTKVQASLQAAWNRGAVIGGTSAGMAVLGEFIYDPAEQPSLTSDSAAANPYNPSMLITPRLVEIPFMNGVITDTHFRNRLRMGRLMGMMAYLRQENRAPFIRGIALSERCALFINKDGIGTVDCPGSDALYILTEVPATARVQVSAGNPLVYTGVRRERLEHGDSYNFNTWAPSRPGMNLSVSGASGAPVYTPADPYAQVATEEVEPTPSGWIISAGEEGKVNPPSATEGKN